MADYGVQAWSFDEPSSEPGQAPALTALVGFSGEGMRIGIFTCEFSVGKRVSACPGEVGTEPCTPSLSDEPAPLWIGGARPARSQSKAARVVASVHAGRDGVRVVFPRSLQLLA